MKRSYISILFVLFVGGLFGQANHKAIVADVSFLRRTGEHVNNGSFPFYFHHKEFVQDVFGDIRKYISNTYHIDSNNIQLPDRISYTDGFFLPKNKLKEIAKAGNAGELFISIETILQESAVVNEVVTYSFITKIKVLNSKGKKVLSSKNKIPFTVMMDETISATVEMGETDFYVFYFDGLEMAFNGLATAPKRYVYKPPTQDYNDFLSVAEMFRIRLDGNDYFYGADAEHEVKVFSILDAADQLGARQLDYDDLNHVIWDRYLVLNTFSGDTLQIQLYEEDKLVILINNEFQRVRVEILKQGKKTGFLESENNSTVRGNLNNVNYRLVWNEKNHVTEIYMEDQLSYIENDFGDDAIIYVHPAVTENQLEDFFTLFFTKDFISTITKVWDQ